MGFKKKNGFRKYKSKYAILHKRGLKLKDADIEFIVLEITNGFKDTQEYLGRSKDPGPNFICSANLTRIGYVSDQQVVNIPMHFLKHFEILRTPLSESKAELLHFDDEWYGRIDSRLWLRNAGREEAIHHYQNIGHPKLQSKLDDKIGGLTDLGRLLCDVEVEARMVVDQIAISKSEVPMWQKFDHRLKSFYEEFYNLTIEQLASLSNSLVNLPQIKTPE